MRSDYKTLPEMQVIEVNEETGEKNIIVCGGYGLNCVANYEYWKEFPDLNIYCEPISHDGGTSIGGAYHVYYHDFELRGDVFARDFQLEGRGIRRQRHEQQV